MERVTLDSMLSSQLGAAPLPVELCDAAGQTVGFFVPDKIYYASLKSPHSEEELRRRERAGGGRTWPEIRADLEKKHGPAGT